MKKEEYESSVSHNFTKEGVKKERKSIYVSLIIGIVLILFSVARYKKFGMPIYKDDNLRDLVSFLAYFAFPIIGLWMLVSGIIKWVNYKQ